MNDTNSDIPGSHSGKPKKKRKTTRGKDLPLQTTELEMPMNADEQAMAEAIANIIQNSVDKYSEIADNQIRDTRTDFDNLQPIISEFLDDFIIIGHTLDGQRVVMRYTATPADLDKLTELCKKVLVRMMIQEQNGQ
jgi:hypothetical protein